MTNVRTSDSRCPHPAPDEVPCAGCTLAAGRRTFLARAAGAVVSALLAVAGSPVPAAASGRPRHYSSPAGHGDERVYPIPDRDGVAIDETSEVILVRWQGVVYALSLACPHQSTALRWQEADARFQCPKHKSRYRPDGTFIEGRATRGMDRFAIRRQGASVVVDLDLLYEYPANPDGWTRAFVALDAAPSHQQPTHYEEKSCATRQ
jgi:Rieske Fe-S protein